MLSRRDSATVTEQTGCRAVLGVVVTKEDSRVVRQRMNSGNGIEQLRCVAAGKIAAGRAISRAQTACRRRIRHRRPDSSRCRPVWPGVSSTRISRLPSSQGVAFHQQAVELASVGGYARQVEDPGKRFLHLADSRGRRRFARRSCWRTIVRCRQVIRVRVGFQHPLDAGTPRLLGCLQNAVDEGAVGHSADRVIDPHRVDDGGHPAVTVGQQVCPGAGVRLRRMT